MNFNELLPEIISTIFGYLRVRNRKSAALVCKNWKDATYCSSFYNWAVFQGQTSIYKARKLWTKGAYHPFSAIEFGGIDEFPTDFTRVWNDLGKTVTTLHFNYCNGLSEKALSNILDHMPNVNTVILDRWKICPGNLGKTFPSVTVLKLEMGEWPVPRIADLSQSFPNLQHLHLERYFSYSNWEDMGYIQNGDLAKMAKNSTAKIVHFDGFFLAEDPLLMELMDIPNVVIESVGVEFSTPNLYAFHKLIENKGSKMAKLRIQGAQWLQASDFAVIKKFYTKLRCLELTFESTTTTTPDWYPFELIKDFHNLTCLEFDVDNLNYLNYFAPLLYPQTEPDMRLPNLKILTLAGFQIDTYNREFQLLLQALPNLIDLCIRACQFGKENFKAIVQHCPKLQSLTLLVDADTPHDLLGDKHFHDLRNLEQLTLNAFKKNINANSLELLVLTKLRYIYLYNVYNLSPHAVFQISESCPHLEEMHFYGCEEVTTYFEEIKSILALKWEDEIPTDFERRFLKKEKFIRKLYKKMPDLQGPVRKLELLI